MPAQDASLSNGLPLDEESVPLRGAGDAGRQRSGHSGEEYQAADSGSSGEDPFVEVVEDIEGLPHRHRHRKHGETENEGEKSGVVKASGNLFIAVVGAGVLGLPYAFRQSGLLLGAGFLIVVAAIALYCMMLLVRCKRHLEEHGVVSYGEVTRATLGKGGQKLVDALLFISQTGFCVAYLIFIKANVASLLPIPGNVAILALLLPLLALNMLRGVAALAPFSLVADFAMISGFAVVLFDDMLSMARHMPPIQMFAGWSALPYMFGVAIYCFEGVGMILPIEASMHTPRHFDAVLAGTMAAVTALYVAFGMIGYIAFGEATQDIITFNLPSGWSTPAVKVALCIGLFLTFPPMLVPVFEIIERALTKKRAFRERVGQHEWAVFRCIRAAVVVTAALLAMFVPGFGNFISLIGSLACALLAFVIPTICHLKIFGNQLPWWQYILDLIMVAFGVLGAVIGTIDSVTRLVHTFTHF